MQKTTTVLSHNTDLTIDKIAKKLIRQSHIVRRYIIGMGCKRKFKNLPGSVK